MFSFPGRRLPKDRQGPGTMEHSRSLSITQPPTADSPDSREADKCRKVISMGHPGWDLWPIVIDPAHAPSGQGAGPYLILLLACLPALDMESEAGAVRVLDAIRDTGASAAQRKRLTMIIPERVSQAA
jgi:hypothetical protein